MPYRTPRACGQPGCAAYAGPDGYCAQHSVARATARERERGSAASRGYGRAWQAARARYLRTHPYCVDCAKHDQPRVTLATVVDHIVPHRGDPVLFWDEANWQALCAPCHGAKTAREDGRWSSDGTPTRPLQG